MANAATLFVDPAGNYTGGYTSHQLQSVFAAHSSNQTRGVIQVQITSGTVILQMRVSLDAPWLPVRTYSVDTIEEIVVANFMRIVASADAKAWLGETK
jgi:hypothetical protein